MRLNKFLASVGVASRRKCDEIILAGEVSVNGKPVTELGTQINENKDIIIYKEKTLKLPSEFFYLKLNKPKGYICSASDDKGRKTVFDIVKIPNVRLFTVGRLDYNTEGLLLITNDGQMAQSLIHPSFDIEKEYYCTIEGEIKQSELAVLSAGVVENGVRMPKAKITVIKATKKAGGKIEKTRLSIKINEGQNRQIRRMFEAIGKDIVLLKRVAIGEIKLGGLQRGEFKKLSKKEMEVLGLGE
ncbi:MAG: pseudouridine synthase [Clostridia bacterium]|nr:pseudouridine synthase [Clostridia bacterium]